MAWTGPVRTRRQPCRSPGTLRFYPIGGPAKHVERSGPGRMARRAPGAGRPPAVGPGTPPPRFGVEPAMTIRATWNGAVLAESDRTVVVEGNHYFPAEDVHSEYFEPSETPHPLPLEG